MKTERLGQVYAGISVGPKTLNVKCFGIITFNVDGSPRGGDYGDEIIGRLRRKNDIDEIKRLVMKALEGEPNFGLRYEVDSDKIFLLDKKTFEKMAIKSDELYAADVEHWSKLRRPVTVYFSPFRSASTGKVRSKHFLVVDIDGKVVDDWADPRGWVIGFVDKPLTNSRALKLAREFLASYELKLDKKDRVYRLNPQAMKNKLNQLAVKEPGSESG